MKSLLTYGIISNFRSLADKTLKIELHTQEHTPELLAQVSSLHQSYCNIYITDGEIDKEGKEILDTTPVDKSQIKKPKTKSQQLRAVLFVLWQQENKGEDFEEFYNKRMDLIIDQIKDRLE